MVPSGVATVCSARSTLGRGPTGSGRGRAVAGDGRRARRAGHAARRPHRGRRVLRAHAHRVPGDRRVRLRVGNGHPHGASSRCSPSSRRCWPWWIAPGGPGAAPGCPPAGPATIRRRGGSSASSSTARRSWRRGRPDRARHLERHPRELQLQHAEAAGPRRGVGRVGGAHPRPGRPLGLRRAHHRLEPGGAAAQAGGLRRAAVGLQGRERPDAGAGSPAREDGADPPVRPAGGARARGRGDRGRPGQPARPARDAAAAPAPGLRGGAEREGPAGGAGRPGQGRRPAGPARRRRPAAGAGRAGGPAGRDRARLRRQARRAFRRTWTRGRSPSATCRPSCASATSGRAAAS